MTTDTNDAGLLLMCPRRTGGWPHWRVLCGTCNDARHELQARPGDIRGVLADLGWKESRTCGWICPACRVFVLSVPGGAGL